MNENKVFTDNTKAVIMPQEKSIDLNRPLDFEFAEFLIKKGYTRERRESSKIPIVRVVFDAFEINEEL